MKERHRDNQYFMWGLTAFLVGTAAVAVVFAFLNIQVIAAAANKVLSILRPVIYGVVMAYLISPVYNRVRRFVENGSLPAKEKTRKSFAKLAATVFSAVLLVTVAIGLVLMILPELYRSVTNVLNALPQNIQNVSDWVDTALSDNAPYKDELRLVYNNVMSFAQSFADTVLKPNITKIISQTYLSVMGAARSVYDLVIGLIVMIYLLNIKETLVPQCKRLLFAVLPTVWAERVIGELHYINSVFGGFIIGKLVDSLIIGILCFAFLSFFNMIGLLHMPYVLLVSVIVGVTNVIPFFGPFIGAVPSAVLIALSAPLQALWFVLFVFVLQQFDGNFLGPKILGESTGVSSFWVLFSILLFGGLFGFAGMIIAVPTWAVLQNLVGKVSSLVLRKKGLPDELDYYAEK